MHQPRPFGRFGAEVFGEDAAAVEHLVRRLTNLKQSSEIESLKLTRHLPGGGMATAFDMGGIRKVFVQAPQAQPPAPSGDGLARTYVPMLFSGVIDSPYSVNGGGVALTISEQTRRRLAGYDQQAQAGVAARQVLQRFVVTYGPRFPEFEPRSPTTRLHTQYVQLRPTWYSGAMAQVVQIVGGYGRQDLDKLPDHPVERARLQMPPEIEAAVAREVGAVRLPGYAGLPPASGQIQYDYKANDCNAVGFDTDGKPWLLRIHHRGVWAMPLPLIPATATASFRAWVEEVTHDEEILWALDRFGGLPSGEGFPAAEQDFEAWRRAGVICKVCDASDFYDHSPYSTACGWSINASGTEGYNTCFNYDEAEGLAYGLAYKLSLGLAPVPDGGQLPDRFVVEDLNDQRKLNAYLSAIYRVTGSGSARDLAIKYKLRRVPAEEVLARASAASQGGKAPDGQAEAKYWDDLELPPIAPHSGSIVQVGRGWLHHPATWELQPQIKFPEPWEGACLSFDFRPLRNGRSKNPRCDTLIHAYYIGDQLKTVRYFRDVRPFTRRSEDNFEECMTVGSWERREHAGAAQIVGHFSTSDIDVRETIAEHETVTTITGSDLGYDHTPFFAFDAPGWKWGTISRNRYVKHETRTVESNLRTKRIGLCIPYLCRDALLHAHEDVVHGKRTTDNVARWAIRDPYTYRFWTYDFVWHHAGPDGAARPIPKNGNPVHVEIEQYNEGPCSDFANQGGWIGVVADYTWLVHPHANVWNMDGGGGPPPVNQFTKVTIDPIKTEALLHASIVEFLQVVHKTPDSHYFTASPGEYTGFLFYRDAARVEAGKAVYANVSETDPEAPAQRKRWGHTRLANHKDAHHFIGVINE